MKPVHLAIAGAIGLAAVGGYAFLDHQFQSQAEQALADFNADKANGVTLSVASLETSLWSRSIVLKEITAVDKATNARSMTIKTVRLKAGGLLSGTADIESASVEGVRSDTFSIDSATTRGANLMAFLSNARGRQMTRWPVDMLEVKGAEVQSNDKGVPSTFSIGTYRFVASEDGKTLKEMVLDQFKAEEPLQPFEVEVGHLEIKGGDLMLLIEATVARVAAQKDPEAFARDKQRLIEEFADAASNYAGIDSIMVRDLSMVGPAGFKMGIKAFTVNDLVRRIGVVLGGRFELSDWVFSGFDRISPQAAQMAQIADFHEVRANMSAQSHFDAAAHTFESRSAFSIDKMIDIRSGFDLKDIDLGKMAKALKAFQRTRLESAMTRSSANANPAMMMGEMMSQLASAYSGYYSGFDASIDITDIGLSQRGLALSGAMNGLPPEQLRLQVAARALLGLGQLYGGQAPEKLQAAVGAFLAEPSSPLHLQVRNKAPVTEAALRNLSKDNWQDLFAVDVAGAAATSAR